MVREREELGCAMLAGGGSAGKRDTPSEMQGEEREAGTLASHTPQATGFQLKPRSISLPPRSYTANSPYVPADGAVTPTTTPYSTQDRTSSEASLSTSSRSGIAHTDLTSTALKGQTSIAPDVPSRATAANQTRDRPTSQTSTTIVSVTGTTTLSGRTEASLPDPPGAFSANLRSDGATEGSLPTLAYKTPDQGHPSSRPVPGKSPGLSQSLDSTATKPAAAKVTASLPGSSLRSGSSRLASVVSPRPFGTQSTKISSVSRARTNSEISDRQNLLLTASEDKARSQPGSVPRWNEEEPGFASYQSQPLSPQTSYDSSHSKMASTVPSASAACFPQNRYEAIRMRLSLRADSTHDFGFQISRQSTRIFIKSIQQGGLAELCQLQVGDAIVVVDGRRVSEMSFDQWEASLDSARQQGSLVLEVRRNGESGSPENYRNSSNEVILQPPLDAAVKSSHTFNSQASTDVDSKDRNEGFRPESIKSKESEPFSLKNLKRRSEFFEQPGGSESAISDICIPSIRTPSTRYSWDPQEERQRQEKWQQEQELLLQEKYKRDQQKLEEEWHQAQLDAVRENSVNHAEKYLEVDTRSPSSPTSPMSQATPPSSEASSRLEEGAPPERAEPHRKEVQRKGQGAELVLQRYYEEVGQQSRPEEEEEMKMCQQVTDTSPKEQDGSQEQHHRFGEGSPIITQISLSDRGKSKSTAGLDEVDNPEVKVTAIPNSSRTSKPTAPPSQDAQKKRSRPLSQVELDRRQILEEMKKKTQLLTDSSWIRQRSTNIYKEPIHLAGGMRRYESLDNLNTARSWRQSPCPLSAAPFMSSSDRPQSATSNSGSSHSYTRSISSTVPSSSSVGSLREITSSQPSHTSPILPTTCKEELYPEPEPCPCSQHPSSALTASQISGEQSLELEPELKLDFESGTSTATSATPDSLMDCSSPCDLTSLLQAEEEATDDKND